MNSFRIGQGDLMILFSSTTGNVLWVMLVLALFLPYFRARQMKKQMARSEAAA